MVSQVSQLRLKGHRFPRSVISYAVWAFHRVALSLRDVEDLLAERGVIASYQPALFTGMVLGAASVGLRAV